MATVLQDSDVSIHPGVPLAQWQASDQVEGAPGCVASTSTAYDAMQESWDLMSTVLAGTPAMRAAREIYLPKHEYETEPAYKARVRRSVLDNYTLRTLETLVGKAFKDPPHFDDKKVPETIQDLFPDMDGQGNTALMVARNWLREGIAKCVGHMWVDFTDYDPSPNGVARTLADDQRDGVRPFWKVVRAEDVRFMQGTNVGGQWALTQVRMYEPVMLADGDYGERFVERIRVLRPAVVEVWEKRVVKKGQKPKWTQIEVRPNPLGYVPWVSFYTDCQGLGEGKPPLEDLAYLNVEHYQSKSDQRNILTVSRFPMLAASGAAATNENDGDKPLIVGPNTWLSMPDPQGKFYFVEHNGKAIDSGREDLHDLEERMSSYGAEFMKKPTGRASATSRQMDSSEAVSLLQSWCYDFRDALERALQITADWLRLGQLPRNCVQYELEADAVRQSDQYELATITAARARGDISRISYLEELIRRGILSDQFDVEEDGELIADELPLLDANGQPVETVGGGPVVGMGPGGGVVTGPDAGGGTVTGAPSVPGLTAGRPRGRSTQGAGATARVIPKNRKTKSFQQKG